LSISRTFAIIEKTVAKMNSLALFCMHSVNRSQSNLFRIPLSKWTSDNNMGTNNNTNNNTQGVFENCGCWTLAEPRWVELDIGYATAVWGVESAGLGANYPLVVNASADGVVWSTVQWCGDWGSLGAGGGNGSSSDSINTCEFPRPTWARWVRVGVVLFDGWASGGVPVFSVAVLGCRFTVEGRGVLGVGLHGDTAGLFFISFNPNQTAAPGGAVALASQPTYHRKKNGWEVGRDAMPIFMRSAPCGGTSSSSSNVSDAAEWIGAALDLLGMEAYLEEAVRRRCAAWAVGGRLVWLVVVRPVFGRRWGGGGGGDASFQLFFIVDNP
jgi:hypothetical protein